MMALRVFKLLAATAVFLYARAASAAPDEGRGKSQEHVIPWARTFDAAVEAASKGQKPLLVDFGAEWCGFCKKLDRETFSEESVIRLVRESFVAVKVDVDQEPDLKKRFKIEGLPTIVFLSPGGEELARLEGFRPPEVFLKEARKPAESSASLQRLRDLAEKDPRDVAAQRAHARAVFATGNAEGALRILRAAQAMAPVDAPDAGLYLDLGDVLRASGEAAAAREAYEKVLALKPEAAGESREKAIIPLASILVSLKETGGALKVLDELLGTEPRKAGEGPLARDRLEARFLRGYVHAIRKDADRALADLKAARDADPDGRWGQRASLIIETIEAK